VAEHTFAGLSCAEVADLAPAFVLGALEAAESDAVRRHLAACPEAHAEMAELHSVVPALFEVVEPVAPPAGLKDRILAAAAADTQRAAETRVPVADQVRDVHRPRVVEDRLPTRGWSGLFRRPVWAAVSLAAALAVVALGVWNVQLQRDNEALVAYRNGVIAVLDEAAQPGAQLAVLSAPEGVGPTGLAAVAEDGTVAVVMRNLAPTSGSEVYEAWLIAGDLAPVPIGELRVGADGTAALVTNQVPLGSGVTVALTREPGPDSTTPTMPIVAVGQAQAS
jgi:anti-sigma-K factor RskA/putative zinc finger protein